MDTITITHTSGTRTVIEIDGMKIQLVGEDYSTRAGRKPRVYASGKAVEPAMEMPAYGSTKGDGSDEDKAWRKYNAEEIRLQKELAKRALEALKRVDGFTVFGTGELRFSRKAGCSCGCSPAMLLEHAVYASGSLMKFGSTKIGDIFVEAAQ